MSEELNLPWKLYLFNSDGKYDPEEVLTIKEAYQLHDPAIRTEILKNIKANLEVRITDSLDYCIMRWVDGKKVFPK